MSLYYCVFLLILKKDSLKTKIFTENSFKNFPFLNNLLKFKCNVGSQNFVDSWGNLKPIFLKPGNKRLQKMKSSSFSTPYPQQFSLPPSIIYYILMSPCSYKGYENLQQTCKHFFAKNPLIIADYKFFNCEWRLSLLKREPVSQLHWVSLFYGPALQMARSTILRPGPLLWGTVYCFTVQSTTLRPGILTIYF